MDENNKKVGKKPAQYKKYPAKYKEYGGSGKGVEDSETEYNPVPDIEAGKGEGSGKVKWCCRCSNLEVFTLKIPNTAESGAAAVAKVLGAALPDPDESKKAKPLTLKVFKQPSPIPDYSASLNTKVPKAPTLTGNSYAGHSNVSDIVESQSSNRDFSSKTAMNLKDNQISRNSQFHYDTGNTEVK